MATSRNTERVRFRYGMCLNDNCSKCKSKEVQEIPARKDLVCTECGKPLRECPPPKKSSHLGLIIGVVVAVFVVAIGAYFLLKHTPESENITISLNHDKVTINVGELDTLKVEVSPSDINCDYEWESSDTSVLSVKEGIVTAIQRGNAKVLVTAKTDGSSAVASCDYIVNENDTLKMESDSISVVGVNDSMNDSIDDVTQDNKIPPTTSNSSMGSSEENATLSNGSRKTVNVTTLVCGRYEGPMTNGAPDGIGGTVYITRDYTISLKDGVGGVVEVSSGDKIVDTKFKDGVLQQGQLIRTNGERKYLSGLAEQL